MFSCSVEYPEWMWNPFQLFLNWLIIRMSCFCFVFYYSLKHRFQGYIAGKSDLLTLDVKKLPRKFCSLARFGDIIYLGGDDQFPPETLPHTLSVQSMRHSVAVSLISSRLTNHRWEQHPSFHPMRGAGLLKIVPIEKEAVTITQDTLILEKRKTEEKMRDPRS